MLLPHPDDAQLPLAERRWVCRSCSEWVGAGQDEARAHLVDEHPGLAGYARQVVYRPATRAERRREARNRARRGDAPTGAGAALLVPRLVDEKAPAPAGAPAAPASPPPPS